jgi:hypothetical protein
MSLCLDASGEQVQRACVAESRKTHPPRLVVQEMRWSQNPELETLAHSLEERLEARLETHRLAQAPGSPDPGLEPTFESHSGPLVERC